MVFLSYKREEVDTARSIQRFLEGKGYDVWWDEDVQCGEAWDQAIDDALKAAACVVVLWSARSLASKWVRHEASSALDRDVYTPVRIEACAIDPPYDRLQATDVISWDGEEPNRGVDRLLERVEELLPPERTALQSGLSWLGGNWVAVVSFWFVVFASVVLTWQVVAARRQISQLEDLRLEQEDSAKRAAERITSVLLVQDQQTRASRAQIEQLDELVATQEKVANEQQLAALASLELTSLELTWSFSPAPPWAKELDVAAEANTRQLLYSEDQLPMLLTAAETDAAAATAAAQVLLKPSMAAAVLGRQDLSEFFDNDHRELVSTPLPDDPEDLTVGAPLPNVDVELLFPVSMDSSAVVSVNDGEDVTNPRVDESDEQYGYWVGLAYPAVERRYDITDDALELSWSFRRRALQEAVEPSGTPLVAFFPQEFHFVVVHGDMPRDEYVTNFRGVLDGVDTESSKPAAPWMEGMALSIIVNELSGHPFEYKVDWVSSGIVAVVDDEEATVGPSDSDYAEDYRPRKKEYDYSMFRCWR